MKVSLASRARLSFAVVSIALVAVGLAPTPAHAVATCVPVGQDSMTVGVLGQPVATTPDALVTVCVSAPTPGVTGTPGVRVDTGCCSLLGLPLRSMTVWLDSVSSPPSTVTVTVSFEVDGTGDSRTVSVPVGGTSGSSTCLFFRGDAANNPGGCVLFLED